MVFPTQVCRKGALLVKLGLDWSGRCEDCSATEEGQSAQPKCNRVLGRVGVATCAGNIDQIATPAITVALVVEIAGVDQRGDGETSIHVGLDLIGVSRERADDVSCIINGGKRDRRRESDSGIGRYRVHYGRNRSQVGVDGL